jgi:hypothetical protein
MTDRIPLYLPIWNRGASAGKQTRAASVTKRFGNAANVRTPSGCVTRSEGTYRALRGCQRLAGSWTASINGAAAETPRGSRPILGPEFVRYLAPNNGASAALHRETG